MFVGCLFVCACICDSFVCVCVALVPALARLFVFAADQDEPKFFLVSAEQKVVHEFLRVLMFAAWESEVRHVNNPRIVGKYPADVFVPCQLALLV
jgi:hypothetical protein